MLITVSGKGGVGKTTLSALILDEYARREPPGLRALAVDADPATTLHIALGLDKPGRTVANVRDEVTFNRETLAKMPPGQNRAGYIRQQLLEQEVLSHHSLREMSLDFLSLGHGEGRGCYCGINHTLADVLSGIVSDYDLVVIDAPAGLEHLNRYILPPVDLFLVVATPSFSALSVADRIAETIEKIGIQAKRMELVLNRALSDTQTMIELPPILVEIVNTPELIALEQNWQPVIKLADDHPVRETLWQALTRKEEKVCA